MLAVNVLGASNICFTNCNLAVNYADNTGGAVKTVGSNVTFSTTAFYQNRVCSAQAGSQGECRRSTRTGIGMPKRGAREGSSQAGGGWLVRVYA